MFFIIGILFLPITTSLFQRFFDGGYIFSKVLGTLFISYSIFIIITAHILLFTQLNCIIVAALTALFLAAIAAPNLINDFFTRKSFLLQIKKNWEIIFFEEVLFLSALISWSVVRSFLPDIHGLEKFMDFGFVNSILRSDYFPSKDMWFTPFSINYYYFGHLTTAILTKLSGISSFLTYNLMIATLFAFAFVCTFSLGYNFSSLLKNIFSKKNKMPHPAIAGLISAVFLSLGGNLHAIYTFFQPYQNEHPVPFWQLPFSPLSFPNLYWYPNATRFIYNTIHEFPIYSFVVSDLHGHVLSIPIVLTIIALLFSIFAYGKHLSLSTSFMLAFLIAAAYMTNAWDAAIYFLLIVLVFIAKSIKEEYSPSHTFLHICIVFIGFFIFTLPFNLFFKPFVSGIGVLCAPDFLTNIGKIGSFLFEPAHCQHSPPWQLFILYGFFYWWVSLFIIFLYKKKKTLKSITNVDIFAVLLIVLSTLLIVIPEIIYMKDIYPAHYRANTMFKLTYQSFMMLSLVSGYIIVRLVSYFKFKISHIVIMCIGIAGIFLVLIYPYFAITSYYNNFKDYNGLNGISYLQKLYPDDFEAISWLNQNIKGQPIILEAQGDSYTDYARVSTNTGLPTVLGWTVHEWLWRGTYDIPAPRIADVQTLYQSTDIEQTKQLLKKYDVTYVFIGDLERQKYPILQEDKFMKLGKIVHQKGLTKIYKLNSF